MSLEKIIERAFWTSENEKPQYAELPKWGDLASSQRIKVYEAVDLYCEMKITSGDVYNAIRTALMSGDA